MSAAYRQKSSFSFDILNVFGTIFLPDMPSLLNQAALATEAFVKAMPKTQRKRYGQFFTSKETAKFMAKLFCTPKNKSELEILDAGAGSGILSIALVERLLQEDHIRRIHLTCYETDPHILPILRCNLDALISDTRISVSYEIKTENYITSQEDSYNDKLGTAPESKQYDMIIGNPPYMKISKNAPEAKAMSDVCHGAPNLYFLFATMGIMNLREDSEMVYIIPRSWTSGAYFKEFRKKLLSQCVISHIHLFGSRNKVFDGEQVLQETMILKVLKTSRKKETVTVTTSASNKDFSALTTFHAEYDQIVKGAESYVYLITDKEEEYAIRRLSRWEQTLTKLGLQMKTGLTVDFREKELLRQTPGQDTIPLFFPHHIKQGKVVFPIGKGNEYLSAQKKALTQRNSNYLFIKRFTAKEEPRRLQCGIYLARKYSEHAYISTQNKINFIGGLRDLSECVVYGLYVLFNSSIYDTYYRILNGSTQVNSTEMNNLPVPDLNTIEAMGKKLISRKSMAESVCNEIIENYI